MLTVKYFSITGIERRKSIADVTNPGTPALYLIDTICQEAGGNNARNLVEDPVWSNLPGQRRLARDSRYAEWSSAAAREPRVA